MFWVEIEVLEDRGRVLVSNNITIVIYNPFSKCPMTRAVLFPSALEKIEGSSLFSYFPSETIRREKCRNEFFFIQPPVGK